MKKQTLVSAFSIAVSLQAGMLGAQACNPPDETTRMKIEQIHQRDADASRQTGPAARQAILDLLTDDVIVLAPGSAPVAGKAAWARILEQNDAAASDWVIDSYVETYPEIVVCGDVAYEWGSITTQAHDAKSGRHATQVGNSMRILTRTAAGDWLIHRLMFNTQSAS